MKVYTVDSFTNEIFKGNPAAVCLVESPLSNSQMLDIAREFNLSETAFIYSTNIAGHFDIRYFSIKQEIPLCGHATLASAKVAFQRTGLKQISFKTGGGINLNATLNGDFIEMKLPLFRLEEKPLPKALIKALGNPLTLCSFYNKETNILLLEIENSVVLEGLNPDFGALVNTYDGIDGVCVTARSKNNKYDFYSRFFWPWSGSDEDPVTGGTHTFLAKYWADKLDKKRVKSFQCSKRSGSMEIIILNDKDILIKAQAVLVFEGNLQL